MDVEEELQQPEEESEHHGVHHNGRDAGALVGELDGAIVTRDLQQESRLQHNEQDGSDD